MFYITMNQSSTVDSAELAKFAQHASAWWDPNGPLKTLHDINPVRLKFIADHCNLQDLRVLDVGCGGGILAESLAQAGALVTGLDAEEGAILAAQMHAANLNITLDYVCDSIEKFNAPLFDCITCMELLEHVADFSQIIEHTARLVKKGGYLFLSTLNRTVTAYATAIIAAEYVFSLLPRQTHDFDKFIRPSELARTLREHGFELVDIRGMDYNPFTRLASLCESTRVNYLLVAERI